MLAAYLTTIKVLTRSNFSVAPLARHASSLASSAASLSGLITFEAFGAWYNEGGYLAAQYLELLDLNKWTGEGERAETIMGINGGEEESGRDRVRRGRRRERGARV